MEQKIQNAVLIQNLTIQDLEKIVERAVAKKMVGLSEQPRKEEKKEGLPNFIKRIETAKRLGVSATTLDDWTRIGLIRCHKISNRVYYTEDEIKKAMGCNGVGY